MDNNIMNKTKITQVSRYAHSHIGGIESVIEQICNSLPNEEFEKEIICCSNSEKSSMENGIKYNRCNYFFEIAANTISPQFIYELSKVNTDILNYHMPFIFAVIAHFIARPKYKKLYVTYHSDIVGYDKIMKPFWGIYRKFLKNVDKIHILSEAMISSSPILIDFANKCTVIPFGIDLNENYDEKNLLEIKNTYKGNFIILAMGRLVTFKGFIYAIKAMKNIDGAVLLIAGDGPLKSEFENYINENKLNDKVKLLGELSDVKIKNTFIKACDIFVFPSIRTSESFGIVQLEAMSYSKPVINTNLGTGVNYVSKNNETGIAVEPRNSEQLFDAINLLLKDDKMRVKLGQNARKRVEELFSLSFVEQKYAEFYSGINRKIQKSEDFICK